MKNWLPTNTGLLSILIGVMAMSAVKANAQQYDRGYDAAATLTFSNAGSSPIRILPRMNFGTVGPCPVRVQYWVTASNARGLAPLSPGAYFFPTTVGGPYNVTIRKYSEFVGNCHGNNPVTEDYTVSITVEDFSTRDMPLFYCPPLPTVEMRNYIATTAGVAFSIGYTVYPNGMINLSTLSSGSHTIRARKQYDNGLREHSWTIRIGAATSISTQPAGGMVCSRDPHDFWVTASGTNLSYQWQKNGNPIVGGNTRWYVINGVTANDAGDYRVIVSGACGSVTSANARITVNERVTISNQPVGNTLCLGEAHTFSVTASGTPSLGRTALSYQWQRNVYGNTVNVGGNASAYTITGATANDAADYWVIVSGACPSVYSDNARLTVNAPVSISVPPVNGVVCSGGTHEFRVTASGANLSYQWKKNGNNVGGNAGAYTITGATANNAGHYTVTVSGACGPPVTSAVVTLTVNALVTISAQPIGNTLCLGGAHEFRVTASGTNLSYQWQRNGNPIVGGNAGAYTITGAAVNDAGNYRVIVGGACGSVPSDVATLTVNEPVTISYPPVAGAVCPGGTHTFSVTASGTPSLGMTALSYQWQKDGNDVGGNAGKARNYTITGAAANDAGNYRVIVSGVCGPPVPSAVATLTVYDPVVITQQPVLPPGNAVCPGAAHTFSVTASGAPPLGGTAFSYQWQKDGNPIVGGNAGAYTILRALENDAGNYTVIVTGACGSVTSAVATLTVYDFLRAIEPPVAGAVCLGGTHTFSVTASGPPPLGETALQYQWQKSGNDVAGENGITYTITGATAEAAGNYQVMVRGACGSWRSSGVTLTVNEPVAISAPPVAGAVCLGGTHTFSVTASAPPWDTTPLQYQWQKNGNSVGRNGRTETYTITGATANDAGNYTALVVRGACGPLTSAATRLTVDEPISISSQPRSATVCKGALFTAAVIANGTNPTYQWLKDGTPTGQTNSTISITPVTENSAGNYRCRVSGGGVCSTPAPDSQESEVATLTVYPDLAITDHPRALTACEGRNYSINVVAVGGGNLSYQWYRDAAIIVGRTAATLNLNNVRAADIGRYKAKVRGTCGELDSQEASVELGASAGITTHPIALQEICRGADYTASVVVAGTAPVTYLWRKDRQAIVGASANPLVIRNVNDAHVGIYTVEIQGQCGSPAVSTGGRLSLVRNITITTPPPSRTICLNTTYTVSVAVEGDGPTYQWLKGAVPIPEATTDTYTINNVTNADAGSYAVRVTGRCNHPTSEPSVLTIVPRVASDAIAFSSPVQNNVLTVCVNSAPVTISSLVTPPSGTFSNAVGLQKNGDQYIFTPAQNNYTAADAPLQLTYHVNIGGCESYKVLSVYVKDNRSVPAIANMPSSICPGPDVRVTLNGTTSVNADAAPYSYEFLSATGNLLSNDNPYSLTVNSDQEEIRIRNINSFGCRSEIVSYTIPTSFGSGNITANKTVINVGESIKFGFSGPSSATFDWSFGDGLKGSIQSPRHYYFAQGDYTVTLEAASGECKKTFTLPIRVNGGGSGGNGNGGGNGDGSDDEPVIITGDRNEKDTIYPNPVKDILYFKGNATFGKKEIEVYSLEGRLYRLAMNSSNSVDVSSLASGVYVLKMGEKYIKFIKF